MVFILGTQYLLPQGTKVGYGWGMLQAWVRYTVSILVTGPSPGGGQPKPFKGHSGLWHGVWRGSQRTPEGSLAPPAELAKNRDMKFIFFSHALLLTRSDSTSHSAMSSVQLSVHGRTPPMLNWPPPYPLPTQHSWIQKVTPRLTG